MYRWTLANSNLSRAEKAAVRGWKGRLPPSRKWVHDDIDPGVELIYVEGLEEGPYLEVTTDGKLTIGTYEGGLPYKSGVLFRVHLVIDWPIRHTKQLLVKLLQIKGDK